MFRYGLVILLVNFYNCGLGLPVDNTLGKSLEELAQSCENNFLSTQIRSKIDECNKYNLPKYNANQIKCLFFLDINNQLCSSSKPIAITDFETKVNNVLNVSTVCSNASNWHVNELKDYPQYKLMAEKIFMRPLRCTGICALIDVTSDSDDTSFFCKYYNWGSHALIQAETTDAPKIPINKENIAAPTIILPPQASNNQAVLVKSGTSVINTNNVSLVGADAGQAPPSGSQSATKQIEVNKGANDVNVNQTEMASQASSNAQILQPEQPSNTGVSASVNTGVSSSVGVELPIEKIGSENGKTLDIETAEDQQEVKPPKAEEQPVIDQEQKTAKSSSIQPTEQKEPVIDNPKTKQQVNDPDPIFPDSEMDLQNMDDSDDAIGDLEEQVSQPRNKETVKQMEIPAYNGEVVNQREFFPNALQDSFTEDDNDHFFSFFLTAVVLVILLYVLYHNKSKVTKVVLGLIVEGRQPGRRRNSRGLYRRLDTLEQAMSSNTSAAPPSKMIY